MKPPPKEILHKVLETGELKEALVDMLTAMPGHDEIFYQYGLAHEVLIQALGRNWVQVYLFSDSKNPAYLNPTSLGIDNDWYMTHRPIRMADNLYVLRQVDGFGDFLDSIRTRDIVGAAFELESARHLYSRCDEIAFKKLSGQKGQDYDLTVSYLGSSIAVEVKSIEVNRSFDAKSFRNSLKKWRKQLPSTIPGVILLKIPEQWTRLENLESELATCITTFFKNDTNRVNCIFLTWEQWTVEPASGSSARSLAILFRHYLHPNPLNSIVDIEKLFMRPIITVRQAPVYWEEIKLI